MRKLTKFAGVALIAVASAAAAVAGVQAIRATVNSDGSSTVAPFAQAAAESPSVQRRERPRRGLRHGRRVL